MSGAPSGEQIELHHGDHHAVVVEVGGGIRSYRLGERHILAGYGEHEICSSGRGQLLLPWPNRVKDGSYAWNGRQLQLDINEVARHNALHGLVAWRNWRVAERADGRVVMRHTLHPSTGYPFELELEVGYSLDDDGLTLAVSALNTGEEACPYGFGCHPYIAPPGLELIDECEVRLPARSYQHVDERLIPYENAPVAGTEFDFREPRAIGATVLDHCFLDLLRDDDRVARATVAGPAGTTTLWSDPSCPFLQVFSSDPLEPPQRRSGLAIEPMTCAPNAFVSGEGLIRLEPGERHLAVCGITPS